MTTSGAPSSTRIQPRPRLAEPEPELVRRLGGGAAGKRVPRASPATQPGHGRRTSRRAIRSGCRPPPRLGGVDLALHPAAAARRSRPERGRAEQSSRPAVSSAPGLPGARVYTPSTSVSSTSSRAQEHRHLRGEGVVVAEPDLVGRGRVVLVHDRDGAGGEQRVAAPRGSRSRRSATSAAVSSTWAAAALPGERFLPRALQPRLPERGRRLQLRRARGRAVEPEPASPSAIAPDETTQTRSPAADELRDLGGPRRTSSAGRGRARRRRALEPSLTTSRSPALGAVADDVGTGAARVAVGDRPARARHPVDVDSRLRRAGEREPSVKRVGACQNAAVPR